MQEEVAQMFIACIPAALNSFSQSTRVLMIGCDSQVTSELAPDNWRLLIPPPPLQCKFCLLEPAPGCSFERVMCC